MTVCGKIAEYSVLEALFRTSLRSHVLTADIAISLQEAFEDVQVNGRDYNGVFRRLYCKLELIVGRRRDVPGILFD